MLIVLLDDSDHSNYYDVSSLIGCSYSTLPPITMMYDYQHAPTTGCAASGYGCWYVYNITFRCCDRVTDMRLVISGSEPYSIVLTSADHPAAMLGCATRNYSRLPALGFQWETETTLARNSPIFASVTSSTISTTSISANSTPGGAIVPVASTPTVLPNITQPPPGDNSTSLSGRAKAGIAVGSIIGGWALMATAAVLLWRYRKRRIEQQQPEFSCKGLENAHDNGQGGNPDQIRQEGPPMLPEHLVSELDTKDTAGQVSEMPGIGSTELTGSSTEKTELTGSSLEKIEPMGSPTEKTELIASSPTKTELMGSPREKSELADSSPTTAELIGSPIVSPTNDGSESPVLPPETLGPLSISSGETLVSPSPPPLRLPSVVGSIPEELGRS